VYVASASHSQIYAFAAALNGTLRAVAGSPFTESGTTLAAKRRFLFSSDSVYIYSFAIDRNGALSETSSINAQALNGYADGGPVNLFLDRSGATLYDLDIYGNIAANNTYQYFDIDPSTGVLSYLGATSVATPNFESALTFVGSDDYGYGAGCYHGSQDLYGFSRNSTGTLDYLDLQPPFPAAQNGAYCPSSPASDGHGHLAVPLSPNNDMIPTGPTQLAVYSVDASGTLSTSSTYQNMPTPAVGALDTIAASPSGKLLAVAGSGGLQVFHFNDANPITPYTELLTTASISQIAWDNDDHLYAISPTSGQLFVFNVTSATYSQAPGSPYSIASPESLALVAAP
jgi:hypothetical protein